MRGWQAEWCSVFSYPPGRGDGDQARNTAVYIPPSKTGGIAITHPSELAKPKMEDESDPRGVQLMRRDFNPSTWRHLSDEWRCETPLWQPTDRGQATRNGGGVLDRTMPRPGAHMLEDWFHTKG